MTQGMQMAPARDVLLTLSGARIVRFPDPMRGSREEA